MDAKTSKTAMDKLLDEVSNWQPTGTVGAGATDLPYITHEGVLELKAVGISVKVHQLSNGMRIIPQDELERVFTALGRK